MKILVTGSRTWTNWAIIERELKRFPRGTILVHGAARGADSIAAEIAKRLGFERRGFPADWDTYGNSAGPIRNSQMLAEEHPDVFDVPLDLGLAFTFDLERSKGTRDMVRKLRKARLPVEVFAS